MKRRYAWLIIFFLLNSSLYAQGNYKRIDNIPVTQNGVQLKNPWAGGLNHPFFSDIDLNGDGIKDIVAFDFIPGAIGLTGRIECFLNAGITDSVDYTFSSAYAGHFPYLHDWAFLRDYNCDGKEDIFALSDDDHGIKVYQNVSSGNNLQFNLVTPSLNMIQNSHSSELTANAIMYPAFVDVDNDQDLDILELTVSQPRTVVYYKNTSEENGWGCDSLAFQYETSCWGHFMFAIGPNEVCDTCWKCPDGVYLERYGMNYNPADAARLDDSLTNIYAFDVNGDGTQDLLIGDLASSHSLLLVNGGTPADAVMVSQDTTFPSYDKPIDLSSFTRHAAIDVDNDGKKDLLVSSTYNSDINNVLLYKNTSATAADSFSYRKNSFLQDQMIDVGENAYPVFFDYNNDNLVDLVIGSNVYDPVSNSTITELALYKNVGTATSPAFELVTNDFAGISTFNGLTGPVYPAFGDMDGDGKADLLLGCGDGTLVYFKNTAASGQPASFTLTASNYFNIDVGDAATPQIIDLDHDGVPDLVIGKRDGSVSYYHNNGSKNAANFNSIPDNATLGNVNTAYGFDGYSVPFVYTDSGHYKMLLAGEQGYLIQYGNIDGNLNSTFTLIDTLLYGTEGPRISVSGADINSDGKMDLVIGNYAGGAGIYSQSMLVPVPTITQERLSFEVMPNPANNELSIHLYNLHQNDAVIKIDDLLGRAVRIAIAGSSTVNMDVTTLPSGIYIVSLQSDKSYAARKLVIRH